MDNLLKLADKNLAASIKHRITHSKNGTLRETDSYMIYTTGVYSDDAHVNGVLCFDTNYDAEEVLHEAENFFKPMKRSYSVWVRDHEDFELEMALRGKGLEPRRVPGAAGMVIKQRIESAPTPEGFELKRVTTSKEVQDFSQIVQEAFDKSPEVGNEMFSSDSVLISPDTAGFIIYKDNKPVASVTTVITRPIAGIYWVGVVESARGQGLGSSIAQAATNLGFDLGAEAVILQASLLGESVYEKLGYETVTYYRTYRCD